VKEIGAAEKGRLGVTFVAGAGIVLVLGVIVVFLMQHTGTTATPARQLPFGPEEQTYAQRIHVLDLRMAQASNFLDQQVTYVAGTLANDGVRTIREVEITLEFRDASTQVVLRETRSLVGVHGLPVTGGQRRDFQISLESLPDAWNHQYPDVRVTGLALEP
jgi:hypothetical protein